MPDINIDIVNGAKVINGVTVDINGNVTVPTIFEADGTVISNRIINLGNFTLQIIDELSAIILDVNGDGELGVGTGSSAGFVSYFGGRVGILSNGLGLSLRNSVGGKTWDLFNVGSDLGLYEAGVSKNLGIFAGGTFAFGSHTALAIVDIKAGTTALAPLLLNAGTNTTAIVDGAIEFDGTSLTIATGGTRKNLLGIVPAVQTALDGLTPLTTATTGDVIAFNVPIIYNDPTVTGSGNITDNLTGAKIGYVQKIYHNKATAPTFPAGWVSIGSGTYSDGVLNIIYAEWVSGTRVEYWIVQPT